MSLTEQFDSIMAATSGPSLVPLEPQYSGSQAPTARKKRSFAWPVLIAVLLGIVMLFLATRRPAVPESAIQDLFDDPDDTQGDDDPLFQPF